MIPLLKGLRIIDATAVILGPYATQILGDLGADVIKIEPPGGDSMRVVPPVAESGMTALFANNNRNKRSLMLDLKLDSDKAVMKSLISSSDALIHNMRQEAFDRLGFGVSAVRAINPNLVYCAAVGYGSNGPYAGRPAYDDVIQAQSGLSGLFAMRDGTPALAPSIVADKVVGLHVVYAVLAALLHRERTGGQGMAIEVPMFEAMTAFTMNEHLDQATFHDDGSTGYARALAVQRKPYRTADGWIAVLPYTLGHWQRALVAIGRPEQAELEWLKDGGQRNLRAPHLYELLEFALPSKGSSEWLGIFQAIDVPCGRVNTGRELLDDPHLREVGLFDANFDRPTSVIRTLNLPIRFDKFRAETDRPPQSLGESNRELIEELGVGRARYILATEPNS